MECAKSLLDAFDICESTSTFCMDAFLQEFDMLHPGFC